VRVLPLADDLRQRIPRQEVESIQDVVAAACDRAYGPGRVHVALTGSYRRNARTQGDVDLVITPVVPIIRSAQRGEGTVPDPFGRPGYVSLSPVIEDLHSSGFVSMGLTTEMGGAGGFSDAPALETQRKEEVALEGVEAKRGLGAAKDAFEKWRRECYVRTVERVREDVQEGEGAAKQRRLAGTGGEGGGGGEEPPPLPAAILPWPPVAYDNARWMGIVRLPDVDAGSEGGEAPHLHRRLDILSYCAEMASYVHLYFTGPQFLNRTVRAYVDDAGWVLGDHGLKPSLRASDRGRVWEGNPIECVDESSIFAACGLPYLRPELMRAQKEDVGVGEALEAIRRTGARFACPDGLPGLQRLVRAGALTREQAKVVAEEAARVGQGATPRILLLEG